MSNDHGAPWAPPVVYEETPLVDNDGAWWIADIPPSIWLEMSPDGDLSNLSATDSDLLTVMVHFNLESELDRTRVIGKNLQVTDLIWFDEAQNQVLISVQGGWRPCWGSAFVDALLVPPAGESPPQSGCNEGSLSYIAALNLDGG